MEQDKGENEKPAIPESEMGNGCGCAPALVIATLVVGVLFSSPFAICILAVALR